MAARRATAMDYEAMTTTMEADPLELSQIEKARITVASFSADGDEAREFLLMLGIHSSQENDSVPLLAPNVLPNSQ